MMDRYTKSDDYLARALKVTPGGAQTLSKRASRFPEGAYPTALTEGMGAYVWDLDGHKYLDMICGLACMTLGYARRDVVLPVAAQLGRGVAFSLATELEADVAEKICAMIPCAEMVRFTKTGSESTEAAIRIARKATGREQVITVGDGYSSWHSWFQVLKPEHPGIPCPYAEMVRSIDYNATDEELELSFQKYDPRSGSPGPDGGWWRCDIAAVILEPCHYIQPRAGFLEKLCALCDQRGAVLIFDEMVTGFRFSNGGAQEYFNVIPDLACFGKACANGFPLSFVCGKRELMEHADVVSGTFGGEAMSLAACNAVLDIYRDEPIIETLWARGTQFQDGFNDMAEVLGVPVICDGFAVKPRIKFLAEDGIENIGTMNNRAMSLFLQETALRGILWHPAGGNISAAMTEKDIDDAIMAMGLALNVVGIALQSGDWSVLKGKPIQSTTFVRKS